MFDSDELSLGHSDVSQNKYSDVASFGLGNMGSMDFFSTDSLQDMLDIDVRSEGSHALGGSSDISLTLFNELPPLELDAQISECQEYYAYYNGCSEDNSIHNMDLCGSEADSVMVNPSSVMPVVFSEARLFKSRVGMLGSAFNITESPTSSPETKKSHLTFSPNTITIHNGHETTSDKQGSIGHVRRDLSSDLSIKKAKVTAHSLINKVQLKPLVQKSNEKTTYLSGSIIVGQRGLLPAVHTKAHQINSVKAILSTEAFPKPAYSYSCLIAMALKNSQYGCLPVSEIYSFMCEHFPYFKTAPNGWKNSVRHNLSLNKCFEKIERSATGGGQRKGCLWAMNPSKIVKMDEEVQKWSRKDPMAIRKAMVHPEHLEALERGEIKKSINDQEAVVSSSVEDESVDENESDSEIEAECEPDVEVDSRGASSDSGEEQSGDEDADVEVGSSVELEYYNDLPMEIIPNKFHQNKQRLESVKRNRFELQYTYVPAVSNDPPRRKIPLANRTS